MEINLRKYGSIYLRRYHFYNCTMSIHKFSDISIATDLG